jgi:hypothetical protein
MLDAHGWNACLLGALQSIGVGSVAEYYGQFKIVAGLICNVVDKRLQICPTARN